MAFYSGLARLWKLGREVEEALALHDKVSGVLLAMDARLRVIEDRMTFLEADQRTVITEAKAAASAAASSVASGVASATVSDLATRLTRVEVQLETRRAAPSIEG